MQRRKARWLVALVVVLLVLVAAALLRQGEEWTFRYVDMPPTDDALRQALAASPRLAEVEVSRSPEGVHVHYSESLWVALQQGGFPIQDFLTVCDRAGYKDCRGWLGHSYLTWSK